MQNRRRFLNHFTKATSAALVMPFFQSATGQSLLNSFDKKKSESFSDTAQDEDFWNLINQAYTVSPNIINLNNGGVSPQPLAVQEAVEHYNRLSNQTPSYYMWKIVDEGREALRMKLAEVAGCSHEELAINRNSSEALETVIFGLRLKEGDEVVLSKQDYPNMINAWKQRAHRDGIVLKWVDLELPSEDTNYLVDQYKNAFTDKTKLVHITHVINWNGQILPVRQIADEARKIGIEVLVDAAHSFAHFAYNIPDLNCDYYGTSLHKWLCAPFGSGMLYVKKEKISQLYPLLAAPDPDSDDIRKFEHLGTRSFAIEQAIGEAVNFHQLIGGKRKQERLQFLKEYWTKKALELPGISIGTSLRPDFSCGISLLQVKDMAPLEVNSFLFRKYKIHSVAINWENISGLRITPNVYTRLQDLDRLHLALKKLTSS